MKKRYIIHLFLYSCIFVFLSLPTSTNAAPIQPCFTNQHKDCLCVISDEYSTASLTEDGWNQIKFGDNQVAQIMDCRGFRCIQTGGQLKEEISGQSPQTIFELAQLCACPPETNFTLGHGCITEQEKNGYKNLCQQTHGEWKSGSDVWSGYEEFIQTNNHDPSIADYCQCPSDKRWYNSQGCADEIVKYSTTWAGFKERVIRKIFIVIFVITLIALFIFLKSKTKHLKNKK